MSNTRCEYMNECETTDKNGKYTMYQYMTTGAVAKYNVTFTTPKESDGTGGVEHTYAMCHSCTSDCVFKTTVPNHDGSFDMVNVVVFDRKTGNQVSNDFVDYV